MWCLCSTLAALTGLWDLKTYSHKRHQLRVMMRGFGKGVQQSLLEHSFDNKHWYVYCECVYASFWNTQGFEKVEAGNYYMWAHQQKVWYIGKADLNSATESVGIMRRFREHMILSFKPGENQGLEKRYMNWRGAQQHSMCFVPFTWAKEFEVLDYERHLINTLQAPMQDRVKQGSFRVARFRNWKRFRNKPSIEHELQLNECHILKNHSEDGKE